MLNMDTVVGVVLLLPGVLGPKVTGISFAYLTYGQEDRRGYWRCIIDFKRIGVKWYLVILLFAPILNILAALLDILLGGQRCNMGRGSAKLFFVAPLSVIPSILFATLIPYIEELGWRGYVLDRLQTKWSALVSILILDSVWSLPALVPY